MNWRDFLTPYQVPPPDQPPAPALFSEAFLERWGSEPWQPNADDKTAAGKLHTQIVSRITTQRLGYLDGVEATALDSIYSLFQKTRDIVDASAGCRHFDALAWEVLNTHVRPFTAKWHRERTQGALDALDATDEFRAELATLQPVLRQFDAILLHLRDDRPAPGTSRIPTATSDVDGEMAAELGWGIPSDFGGIDSGSADRINQAEREAIAKRRRHYGLTDGKDAAGLALSGGGIRSATFSLGVLVALASRGLLPQFDYLSTVSGGGFLGSFLSAFLHAPGKDIGLRPNELPFRREEGEAAALRHIRHRSRYLATGSLWQRLTMMFSQLYGMALNGIAIVWFVATIVAVELWLRGLPNSDAVVRILSTVAAVALALGAIGALLALRIRSRVRSYADNLVAIPAVALLVLLCWRALGGVHDWYASWDPQWTQTLGGSELWIAIAGAIPLLSPALVTVLIRLSRRLTVLLVILSAIAAPVFVFGIYLLIYQWASHSQDAVRFLGMSVPLIWVFVVVGGLVYLFVFDINFTSPHRHYRNLLADAFLIVPSQHPTEARPFDSGVSIRLSELGTPIARAPYHLVNCSLNVPASQDPRMQGRLSDFFVFSPQYSGSPLTGYQPTHAWEDTDPHLDLGTAMAISGAAAGPLMGLITMKQLSFWLALLNIRLGYWAARPGRDHWSSGAPGIRYLLKEMLGTVDENGPWLNLSDGGHLENLGIYELLRRRCKYIVAVDGEQDASMTFHALTNLQRLAAIDLGVRIDLDLDDLRLNERGLSRSHFRFCRIRYPTAGRGSEDQFGYLLYVKLSLTGNEGEFLRRYRLDEPVFPHHSTADQFFSETQFEAYRALGEHVGDKLFMRAIVGDLAESESIDLEKWFRELGRNLLEPLSARK